MIVKRKMSDAEMAFGLLGIILIVIVLITYKYGGFSSDRLVLKKNKCIREINKNYVSPGKDSQYIYRIEQIKAGDYYIATYSNRDWISLGSKKLEYFKEGSNFRFENIDCPGDKRKKSQLKDKLKELEFTLQ